jgi:uncharacterized protein
VTATARPAGAAEAEGSHDYSLITYFSLTFLLAWVLWIAAAAVTAEAALSIETRALFFLPGTFAPAIMAIVLTLRSGGSAAVVALLGRLFRWRVGARWYAFAISYVALVKLVAAIAHRLIAGDWPPFGQAPLYLLLVAAIFSTPFQAGEEIGWRGYALPRLSLRIGLAPASLVLGVIWAVWHLPLFFIADTTTSGQSFPIYLLSVTALSVAFAWLYWRTGWSLLLVMLLHGAANNTAGIVSSGSLPTAPFSLNASLVAWLTVGVLWVMGSYFLLDMRAKGSPHSIE